MSGSATVVVLKMSYTPLSLSQESRMALFQASGLPEGSCADGTKWQGQERWGAGSALPTLP